jgi:hypothetical protein
MQRRSSRRVIVAAACAVPLVPLAALAASAGAAPKARAAAVPSCTTAGLVVWLNTTSNGAAGSFYYTLELTNLSGHACTLKGYPGVSGVNLSGAQVGSAASRDNGQAVKLVTLANGRTATATLRIVDVLNFPTSSCRPVSAAGLRVYPPGQTASKVVPFPFMACSRTGTVYLNIRAVQ